MRGTAGIAIILLAAALAILIWPTETTGRALAARTVQSQTVRMAVEPSAVSATVGQVVAVDLRVDAGTQPVDAVDAYVTFPAGVVQVVDSAGQAISAITPGTALPAVLQNRADNPAGQITYTAGRTVSGEPATGSFVLATVRFKAIGPGAGAIAFSLAPATRATNAYFQGNPVLGSTSDGSVTVTVAPTAPPAGGGGGGGGGGGSSAATPTPTVTATVTPNATATPVADPPSIAGPPDGVTAFDMAPTLSWANPPGTTQYHVQVLPAPNIFTGQPDGPGLDLIIGDPALVAQARFVVQAPQLGTGNYVLLPGMTYTWRIRTTTAAGPVGGDDPRWGPWASRTFRTAPPTSATITPEGPLHQGTVASLTPTLQWANVNPTVFYYEVQLSPDPNFVTDPAQATAAVFWEMVHGGQATPPNSYTVRPAYALEPQTTYYWRVRPRVQGDAPADGVDWSSTWSFTTG